MRVYARTMSRTALVSILVGALLTPACGRSSAATNAPLCQDLANLQATVVFLSMPPTTATVGEVRGALDKLDSTWAAVHDDEAVPDVEDDALLGAQEDYRDALEGIGDNDSFAPYVATTAGTAQGLERSFEAVRVRLVCPSYLQPG